MECQYGPKGYDSCSTKEMDEWSKTITPQPCGKPFPQFKARVKYHNDFVKSHPSDQNLMEVKE
jgi:hypothetical protein